MTARVAVVVPTVRPAALARLLRSLAAARWDGPIVVVDDRAGDAVSPLGLDGPLVSAGDVASPLALDGPPAVDVVRGGGCGPAAARNAGWRHTRAEWIAFLDDDVIVPQDWPRALRADLDRLDGAVAGSQGRIDVPLPHDRRPTDWERNVAGLRDAWWATADMTYRRDALVTLGGFDERFRGAYREDSDLALRALRAGWRLERGARRVTHPVGPAGPLVSVRRQAGNADDVSCARSTGRAGARRRVPRPAACATTWRRPSRPARCPPRSPSRGRGSRRSPRRCGRAARRRSPGSASGPGRAARARSGS
jgi:hypothetical protein